MWGGGAPPVFLGHKVCLYTLQRGGLWSAWVVMGVRVFQCAPRALNPSSPLALLSSGEGERGPLQEPPKLVPNVAKH